MPINRERNKKILLLLGDILIVMLSVALSVVIRLKFLNLSLSFLSATAFSLIFYPISFYIFDLYNTRQKFNGNIFFIQLVLAVLLAASMVAITFYLLPIGRFGRGIFLMNMVFISIGVYSWRRVAQAIFHLAKSTKVIVILGINKGSKIMKDVIERTDVFQIYGFLSDVDEGDFGITEPYRTLGGIEQLSRLVSDGEVDAVVDTTEGERTSEHLSSLLKGKIMGVEIYNMPDLYEALTGKLPVAHLSDGWLVYTPFQGMTRNVYMIKVKKIVDMTLAFTCLALSLPVILITAIAIKLDSKGPVFYRQSRVGLGTKAYELLKFRSMVADAESGGAVWAETNDPRVTRVGKVIRKARIDELPQIYNVLKGEMSFIGPRPERPEFVEGLSRKIPFYSLRHSVKPGITGWAQINYRYGASEEDALQKLQYDLFYIKNLSPLLDMSIILRTLRVVIFGHGAR